MNQTGKTAATKRVLTNVTLAVLWLAAAGGLAAGAPGLGSLRVVKAPASWFNVGICVRVKGPAR